MVFPRDDARGAPSACNYIYIGTFDPAAPDADPTWNQSGRKQDYYELDDQTSSPSCVWYRWVDATDGLAPAITAADLVPGVWVSVQRQLPAPIPRVAPADFNPKGYAYVQNPTFFWVDQAAGQWAPVTGSASGGGITVSVRADPVRLIVSTGDGNEVVCEGAQPPFRQGNGSNPVDFDGCEYTYHDSSAMAENGETFPLTMTVEWDASWSASTGEGGSFGTRSTTSDVRWLPVAEIQSVITNTGG